MANKPPYPAPKWGRWVYDKRDGWMLHERNPGLSIQAKGKKSKGLKIKDSKTT